MTRSACSGPGPDDDGLAAVMHDLRNPATALLHLGEDLAAAIGDPAELGQQVRQEAALILRMIGSLARPVGPPPREDLCLLAGVAVERARRAAAMDGRHLITAELPDGPLHVTVDSDALLRALNNLLDNSRAYSPDGSHIHLALDDDGIGGALMTVTDEGMGFTPGELEQATHLHFRSTRALAAGIAGSGVGLSSVQALAERHDGELTITSDGAGSTVALRLPLDA